MGVPKVLLPAGKGHTLLSRTLHTSLQAVDGHVFIVLGRDAELCKAEVKRFLQEHPQHETRIIATKNPHYERGLSTSLRRGVQEVLKLRPGAGVMVLLADQPAFDVARARDLIRAFRERNKNTLAVAAAEHGEQRNPVVFSAELLPELLEVEGDKGARGVLKKHEGRVERLELGPGPWFVDTDDWTTYAALMRQMNWLEEVNVPEFTGEVTAELGAEVHTQFHLEPRPLLASDVLLVGLSARALSLMRLEPPTSILERGIETVLVGDSTSPGATLNLLRRAALWTLQRSLK